MPEPLSRGQVIRLRMRTPLLIEVFACDVVKLGRGLCPTERTLMMLYIEVATDIETGPSGNLYVVSLSKGAIYEIFRR